jgi:hypothetical protein
MGSLIMHPIVWGEIFMKLVGGTLLAVSVVFGGSAWGQEAVTQAILNAVSYRPIPAGVASSVQTLDDSSISMAALQELESLLRGSGRALTAKAPLVFTLEVTTVEGAWSDEGRRTVLELSSHGDTAIGDNQKVRFNIFDSSQGGIINEGQGDRGTNIVTRGRHRVELTVDERDGGRRLWQGWIEAGLDRQDDNAVVRSMVGPLVGRLGQTVRRETVDLP